MLVRLKNQADKQSNNGQGSGHSISFKVGQPLTGPGAVPMVREHKILNTP